MMRASSGLTITLTWLIAIAGPAQNISASGIFYLEDDADPLEIRYDMEIDDRLSALIDQVDAAIRNRQWAVAVRLLESMIYANYGSVPVYLCLIQAYEQNGQLAESKAIADELTRQIKEGGHDNKLDAFASTGELDVVARMRQTIARGRGAATLQMRRELAVVLQQMAMRTGRLEDLMQAAVLFAGSGDANTSVQLLTEAMDRFPGEAGPYQGMALLVSGRGELLRAIDYLERALLIKPEDPDTLANLAALYLHTGETTRADEVLARALARQPDHIYALQLQTSRYLQQGNLSEALRVCELAIAHNPRSANAHKRMAEILVQQSKWDDVAGHLATALEIYPAIPNANFYLGMHAEAKSDLASALEHYRSELAINPDFPPALNNLAWLLATSNDPDIRDAETAVALALRACELTKNQRTKLLDTLLEAQAANGQIADAITTAERMIELLREGTDSKQLAACEARLKELRRR